MNQLQKYTWLIETIRRYGRLSLKELSELWKENKDMSDEKPLHRSTLNHWRDAILDQFGIKIACQTTGGYLYYIENPDEIDDDKLKKWMLDSFSVGNIISENLALKNRILVDEIPSGRDFLTSILAAMKDNKVLDITYRPFHKTQSYSFPIEPYCVKFYENRWYVLARNINYGDLRIYALDRMDKVVATGEAFRLPEDFDAEEYFLNIYGIVVDPDVKPERIILRAKEGHQHYLATLPLHFSQNLIEDHGDYADFELYLAPTYDFVMKLLQMGGKVEVIYPQTLRQTMRAWIAEMHALYQNP